MPMETSPERPAPVRAVAQAIGGWIDRLGAVWVEGQVTQVSRRQGMNTVFLTLRDPIADISIPITARRQTVDSLATPLVEGAGIIVHGKPSYYLNRGSLSLEAREIRLVGLGELLARLERLRQLLAAEGLFAEELKRPLPFLPRRIGLVTAHSSAAERDVVENVRRRWPAAQIATVYAAMQGHRSAAGVIEAVQRLDADPTIDVIVVARGGGSPEDLLPFSDEALIRTVHALRTPLVSAIGHEPDSPLLDYVADVRASTPTDAAKLLVPDVAEEAQRVMQARERGRRAIWNQLERHQHQLDQLRTRPVLSDPRGRLDEHMRAVDDLCERARRSLHHRLDRAADDLTHSRARVRALSPLETLRRGYAVVRTTAGALVASTDDTVPDTPIDIRLADGTLHAITTGATKEAHG